MSSNLARKFPEDDLTPSGDREFVKFLIVDDDAVCVMSIKRTFKKLGIQNPLFTAVDGYDALELLRGDRDEEQIVRPYVVLLDLNMPRMGGLEFLRNIREDPHLRRIIIFVMTTSDAPRDITAAYDRNIAGYVMKDNAYHSFSEALAMIENYTNLIIFPD